MISGTDASISSNCLWYFIYKMALIMSNMARDWVPSNLHRCHNSPGAPVIKFPTLAYTNIFFQYDKDFSFYAMQAM